MRVRNLEIHVTSQYGREEGEPNLWVAKLGDSIWLRLFRLMIVISPAKT